MTKLPMPFSNPATYAGHSGVDYAGHGGEPIPASGPGIVVSRGRNDRGGYYIWVLYDGTSNPVGYHHMNSHDGCPALREKVFLGQRLGYVGWTGHVVPAGRAGAHLHSEVSGHASTAGYWKFFDPRRVVGAGAAAGGGSVPVSPSPKPRPTPTSEEDDMFPAVLEIAGDSNAGKSLYDLRSGKAIRAISRDENSSLRRAESKGMAVYISVSKTEYKQRGGK